MAKLESKLERLFYLGVRRAGGKVYKIAPTTVGLPDRMVIIHGQVLLVELKREGEHLSAKQRVLHAEVLARGVRITVLEGEQEIQEWIRSLS